MSPDGFERPWEHLRLLSDGARNQALLALLERRAPGAVVAEVGCGTGLLSLVAAKIGARHVYAIEPTEMADVARQLVVDNHLEEIIEVLRGRIEDIEPRPVDLIFSEMLNADPFYEGVVPAMRAARRWAGQRGQIAPHTLKVWVALLEAPDCAREARLARAEVTALANRYDLDLGGLIERVSRPGSYRYVTTARAPVSEAVLAWDLALGHDDPVHEVIIDVVPLRPGPVAGAVVWFEAAIDEGLSMSNPPGGADHWGQLVCAWAEEHGVRQGVSVPLAVSLVAGRIDVTWAG